MRLGVFHKISTHTHSAAVLGTKSNHLHSYAAYEPSPPPTSDRRTLRSKRSGDIRRNRRQYDGNIVIFYRSSHTTRTPALGFETTKVDTFRHRSHTADTDRNHTPDPRLPTVVLHETIVHDTINERIGRHIVFLLPSCRPRIDTKTRSGGDFRKE